jgi:hypothetical protein
MFYVNKNDQQLGPFTLTQVQRMVATGGLKPDDLAWYEGLVEWIPVDQVPGFADPKVRPPAAKPRRPSAVWVISLWYCFDALLSLYIGYANLRLNNFHVDEIFWTLVLALCIGLKIAVIISLLRLRGGALRILIVLVVTSAILNAHDLYNRASLLDEPFLAVLTYLVALVFCIVNILILYFVWQMDRDDTLR